MNLLRQGFGALIQMVAENRLCYLVVFMLMTAAFFLGLAAPAAMEESTATQCEETLSAYLNLLPDSSSLGSADFGRALLTNGSFLLVILLSGLNMFGLPLILFAAFLKTLACGFTIGFLLHSMSVMRAGGVVLAMIPPNLILLPLLLIAAAEASRFSLLLWQQRSPVFTRRGQLLRRYGKFAFLIGLFLLLAAFLEAYVSPLLLDLAYFVP